MNGSFTFFVPTPTVGTRAHARLVRTYARLWNTSIRAEEQAEDVIAAWRAAAKSERALRALRTVEAGEPLTVNVPRRRAGLAFLAQIGRAIGKAVIAGAALAKAQARNAARRAGVVLEKITKAVKPKKEKKMTQKQIVSGARKGAKASTSSAQVAGTQPVTALYRPYNNNPEKMKTLSVTFRAPAGETIEQLIERAHKAGASKGIGGKRDGVVEVHTTGGVWSTSDGSKLLTSSNKALSKDATFKAWVEMSDTMRTRFHGRKAAAS